MIRKYTKDGRVVEFESARMEVANSRRPIEIPILLDTPDQKYEGTWQPGVNHPTSPPLESGPFAGILRYLPIPESEIQR